MHAPMKPTLASVKQTCWNPDVYPPSDDSFALVDAVTALSANWGSQPPRLVVELGSGSGYVICSAALLLRQLGVAAQLMATDVNPEAAAATMKTLRAHEVSSVDVMAMDLASALQPRINGLVDLLIFNPPYVPTPDEDVGFTDIVAAWAGGDRGRAVIDRILPKVPQLLSPRGEMLMVTVHDNDPQEVIQIMSLMGFEGQVALTRTADEELLHILHFRRRADGPAAAAEAAAASTGPQAGLGTADGRGSQAPGQQAAGPEQPAARTREVAAGQQAGPVQAVA